MKYWSQFKWRDTSDRLQKNHPTLYFFLDLFVNILVIVILVYGVRTYLISPFQVFGPSMCDNLNFVHNTCQEGFGEYLIVNKVSYYPFLGHRLDPPKRGDIVVFHPPRNPNDFYIKRIIGLPDEKVKLKNGKVFIFNSENPDGFELQESYVNRESRNKTFPGTNRLQATYEVPPDYYFVLGDNREKSTDSRHCFRGRGDRECEKPENHFLPINRIEGKASLVLWPFDKIRILRAPTY